MKKLPAFVVIGLVCFVGIGYAFLRQIEKESVSANKGEITVEIDKRNEIDKEFITQSRKSENETSLTQILNLKVKDVEIGTKYSDVLKKLGKPSSKKKGKDFPCDDGEILILKYKGLVLELLKNYEDNTFFVASTTVISDKWSVSDANVGSINVGASIKEVKEKFGDKEFYNEEGFDILGYYNIDGYANFYFKDGKVVKIRWELNVC